MKSRMSSRKFFVTLFGEAAAIYGLISNSNIAIIAGTAIIITYIIGESVVDAASSVKQYANINKHLYIENGKTPEEKDEC